MYDISCPECGLTATAGTVDAVLELQENHRIDEGNHHLLEFSLVDQ